MFICILILINLYEFYDNNKLLYIYNAFLQGYDHMTYSMKEYL